MPELLSSDVQASLSSDAISPMDPELTLFKSSIQTTTARSAAISSMDEEIEAAMRRLRSLLARRNTLVPISLLPPELLSRIFHFHALEEQSWLSPETLGWIRVTHVCRHWRRVALEDSTLWATISGIPRSKRWIAEMLARAKCAPLIINLIDAPDNAIISMFPSQFFHTRELRLRCLSLAHLDNIRELCELEAPVLEHFELDMSDASCPVTFYQLIGTKFFKGNAPELRTFSLCHVRIHWSLIPRTQLSQLRITLPREISNADGLPLHDELDQFIDVLTNSPGLEDLVLQFCLPHMLSHFSRGQTIHLPHLSHLGLAGSSSRVTNLLKALKLPSSTKLHMRCTADNTPTYNDSLILPLISAHFKPVKFKGFILNLDYMERLICLIASTSLPTWTRPHTSGCCLEGDTELFLSMDTQFDFGHLPNTLERMCTMLPIAEVEFLSISAPDMVQPVNWGNLFRRCEKITTIEAHGHGTTTLLQKLTPQKRGNTTSSGKGKKKRRDNRDAQAQGVGNSTSPAPPVFPNLTTLVLKKLNFSENVPHCGNVYDVLSNLLRRRTLFNVPLKSLTIQNSIISINRANALEKLVPDFHCEQEERLSFDDFDDFDYSSDTVDYDERWEDYFIGSSQAEMTWWENYSDGW
jgi:F-box-like